MHSKENRVRFRKALLKRKMPMLMVLGLFIPALFVVANSELYTYIYIYMGQFPRK